MNEEVLISSVHSLPAIWDAFHLKHFSRTYISEQWAMIADALGISGKYNNCLQCKYLQLTIINLLWIKYGLMACNFKKKT